MYGVSGQCWQFSRVIGGALLLVMIPELLRFLAILDAIAANWRSILYRVLLVVMMSIRHQGITRHGRID